MATPINCPHKIQCNQTLTTTKDKLGHQHVENDIMHNYAHDFSMFDHPIFTTITL
jgi:hypothetical protein